MVRVLLIAIAAVGVMSAGVWFSRHFDPEVARLVQQRAKKRLEKELITYLAVEASGREVTVVLPPGTARAEIARAQKALATLEGASSVNVHAFGQDSQNDERIRKLLPKERLTALEQASQFPTPEVVPAPPLVPTPAPKRHWNLSIGRSQGGHHVEFFELGASQ